jgi:transcriptional regulator with XRE-family HTH domain
MMDEESIIRNIKRLRLGRRMTLDRLAVLTGLTKGYLSRIENSKKAPPVSTLSKISDALGTDITEFFIKDPARPQESDTSISITRKDETLRLGRKGLAPGYIYEALAYRMRGKNMESYIITVGEKLSPSGFRHEGEEFIHVLRGKLEFTYDRKKYLLNPGDSAYFDASKVHNGKSIGGKNTRFLCIIYSYKRA